MKFPVLSILALLLTGQPDPTQLKPATPIQQQQQQHPTVPLILDFTGNFSPQAKQTLHTTLETVMTTIQAFAPESAQGHALAWKGDPARLEGKTIIVTFVSRAQLLEQLTGRSGLPGDYQLDSLFANHADAQDRSMQLYIYLFVDRIVYDEAGAERPDYFVRLLIALAAQMLGPTQTFLEMPYESLQPPSPEMERQLAVRGHCAAIRFIDNFATQSVFFEGLTEIKNEMQALKPKEEEGLRSLQSSGGGETCEQVFRQ